MSRRMEARDKDELALDDKLDIVRTITRLKKRQEARHELNDLEAAIKQSHQKEVNSGSVTLGHIPSGEDLLNLFGGGSQAALEATDSKDGADQE